MRDVIIDHIPVGENRPLLVIAGPCVIEDEDLTFYTAHRLKEICGIIGLPLLFKSSFDKANRSSLGSYRGPGIERGLRVLSEVKKKFGLPVVSDVHSVEQVRPAAQALDVLQIPAFLCRQTDIILAAAETGLPVNIKKGQFLAPWDMGNIVDKFTSTGNRGLLLTERGSSFGYNNLVVDYRGLPIMRALGCPVIFDVTHSLQLPGGRGQSSGGQREFAGPLARAAVAVGVDGLFMEVHPEPDRALCDGPNMIALDAVPQLLKEAKDIRDLLSTRVPGKEGKL
jgi:2-dehydro-3-deoxyphosphooctonate aldolase (KDO 8-P synthase)